MRSPRRLMQGVAIGLAVAAIAERGTAIADPLPSLREIPVAGMQIVAPAEYGTASALAANDGTPLEIAAKIAGEFQGTVQQIFQVNAGAESPRSTWITMLRDGFLDDSIRGDRWEIDLERSPTGVWSIRQVKRAWLCRRGAQTDRYGTALCP